MRCIVTGGLGFIGSHLVDLLIEQGHEVLIIDNLSTGKKVNLNPKATFRFGDIRDKNLWSSFDKYDYVFHLAALARIQPSIDDPITSNAVNLDGTLNVLEYCRKHNSKIIFSGSSSVYSGDILPTKESDPTHPKSPYALQKLISEYYIKLYSELYDVPYTILRYFNVYGERQILDGAYAAVVGIFLNQKQEGKPLTITNDGEQKRDFTYVKDVAKANYMAMSWDNNVFNIGTGKNYSINQIAKLIGDKIEYIGKRHGEVMETLADNSKALSVGWKPETDIEDWVCAYL